VSHGDISEFAALAKHPPFCSLSPASGFECYGLVSAVCAGTKSDLYPLHLISVCEGDLSVSIF
jgi:hypothetical protein